MNQPAEHNLQLKSKNLNPKVYEQKYNLQKKNTKLYWTKNSVPKMIYVDMTCMLFVKIMLL